MWFSAKSANLGRPARVVGSKPRIEYLVCSKFPRRRNPHGSIYQPIKLQLTKPELL